MLHKDSIRRLIERHERRLQKLKEQAAMEGLKADPAILIEIEDLEAKIEKLETELGNMTDVVEPAQTTETYNTQSNNLNMGTGVHIDDWSDKELRSGIFLRRSLAQTLFGGILRFWSKIDFTIALFEWRNSRFSGSINADEIHLESPNLYLSVNRSPSPITPKMFPRTAPEKLIDNIILLIIVIYFTATLCIIPTFGLNTAIVTFSISLIFYFVLTFGVNYLFSLLNLKTERTKYFYWQMAVVCGGVVGLFIFYLILATKTGRQIIDEFTPLVDWLFRGF